MGSSLLKKLGIKSYVISDKDIIFSTGSGNTFLKDTKYLSYDEIESIIKSGKKFYITYCDSIVKLRDGTSNIRIIQIYKNKKNNNQLCALYYLYKKYRKKIEIQKKLGAGIYYEHQRVKELNDILNLSKKPIRLYIEDPSKIYDTGIKITSAQKIKGTHKSDIALKNKNKEVFWITYKYGDVYDTFGKVNDYIPFQQYCSLQRLYLSSDFKTIIDHFINKMARKTNKISGIKSIVKNNDNFELYYYDKRKNPLIIDKNDNRYVILNNTKIFNKLSSFLKCGIGNLYFYTKGTKEYYHDFSHKSDEITLKNIIGRTIYGKDYSIGNTNFGRENANILLQTGKNLEIKKIGNKLIIKVDKSGQLLFNSNFLDDKKKMINHYLPIIYSRYTENEIFKWHNSNERNILLGSRIMMIPYGKKSKRSIEIS